MQIRRIVWNILFCYVAGVWWVRWVCGEDQDPGPHATATIMPVLSMDTLIRLRRAVKDAVEDTTGENKDTAGDTDAVTDTSVKETGTGGPDETSQMDKMKEGMMNLIDKIPCEYMNKIR